jgi:predicted Zn finger-like uncharacterized protein
MNWITRCPECATVYQVVPEQLHVAKGWLRCGQCQHDFDSAGVLLAWPKVHSVHATASQQDAEGLSAERLDIDDLLKQEDRSNARASVDASFDLTSFEQALSSFKPEIEKAIEQLSSPSTPSEPFSDQPSASLSSGLMRRCWAWAGLLALSLSLLAQVLWIERHALSARWPVVGASFQRACQLAGCDTEVMRDIQSLVIDTSSFIQQDGAYELQWIVRNTGSQDVLMTALELTLLDVQAKPVLRRVFWPNEVGAPKVLAPAQVWNGRLLVNLPADMVVIGYRVLSFYP